MTTFSGLSVLQASRLSDISAVEPFSEDDVPCLNEIRAVLERHGRSSRFGIALLHKHFDVHEDELLVEHCDVERRILTTQPRKLSQLNDGNVIKTVLAFDPSLERACEPFCPTDAKGRHQGRKDHD